MRGKPVIGLSIAATAALVAGLLTNPIATQLSPAAASTDTVFIGPDYPSPECTSIVQGGNLGIAPQQWNSSVGLPLTPSATPAAQRIVIPEFNEIPSMDAVNALLRQCELLSATDPDVTVTTQSLPSPLWGTPATPFGQEATLDAAVVFAALPPNTEVYIANASNTGLWYNFFVNAAQACGIEFATPPQPTDGPNDVPAMSRGNNYPAGGCIITGSFGGAESVNFPTDNGEAASVVLERLAELGVLVFASAGDEGAGGCLSGVQERTITNIELTSSAGTTPIGTGNFYTGTITVTTSTNHGYTQGNAVVLYNLNGLQYVSDLNGVYNVLPGADPASTTFAVQIPLEDSLTITSSAATGSAYRVGIDWGATFDQNFQAAGFDVQIGAVTPQFPASHPAVVAVGGTQWLPQADTLAAGLGIPYQPGRPYQEFVWKDSNANPNCVNAASPTTLGQEGTGGGASRVFAMPDYQRAAAQASYGNSVTTRLLPDIAALAGWPMYAIPNPTPPNNQFCTANDNPADFPCAAATFPWAPVVGTSAATPLTAVGFANVNAVLSARGFGPITKGGSNDVHSIIYSTANSSAFNDVPEFRGAVRSGNNNLFGTLQSGVMGYEALNGFDMTTGMGVPNFTTLANLLIARNTPVTPPAPAPQPTTAPTATPTPAPTAEPAPTSTPPNPVSNIIANPSNATAATINALTPAQVAAIPPATFGQLPPRAFRGLTPDQARQLSTAQVAAIRPARARKIRPAVLRSFTPEQIETLRPKSIRALRPNQIRLLRPKQLRALTPRQERQIRPKQLQVMTPAQRRALR